MQITDAVTGQVYDFPDDAMTPRGIDPQADAIMQKDREEFLLKKNVPPAKGPRLSGAEIKTTPDRNMRETLGHAVNTIGGLASAFAPHPAARFAGGAISNIAGQAIEGGEARAANALQATLPPMGGGLPPKRVYGYEVRHPIDNEIEFFRDNPNVTGMATDDGKIITNRFANLKPEEFAAVEKLEAARLWMRENEVTPQFDLTPEQERAFAGTAYGKPENHGALKQSIVSRILVNDPSAGNVTPEQRRFAAAVQQHLDKRDGPAPLSDYTAADLTKIAEDARGMSLVSPLISGAASAVGLKAEGNPTIRALLDRFGASALTDPVVKGAALNVGLASAGPLSQGRLPTGSELLTPLALGMVGGGMVQRMSEGSPITNAMRAADAEEAARLAPLTQGIEQAVSAPSPELPTDATTFDAPGAALGRLPGQRFPRQPDELYPSQPPRETPTSTSPPPQKSYFRQASSAEVSEYFTAGDKYPIHTFLADDPNLALGQGANKSGLLVEFDTMPGVHPQSTKPGSAFVQAQGGGGEYTIRAARESLGQYVRSITIPEKIGERETRSERLRLLAVLQRDGWQPTKKADGATQWVRPQGGSPLRDSTDAASALKGEQGSIPLSVLFAGGRTIGGAGVGGTVGYMLGSNPEERKRYATEGAVAGGALLGLGGSPTVGAMLKKFANKAPEIEAKLGPEVEGVADKLGTAARDVEYFKSMGLFTDMHRVADEAWLHLDKLKELADAGKINPENRLYKVINKIVFPEGGAEATRNLESWANTGRIMQRYSELAKALRKEAAKDPEAAAMLRILYGEKDATTPFGMLMHWYRGSLIGRFSTGMKNIADQGAAVGVNAGDRFWEQAVQGKPIEGVKDAAQYLTQPLTNMARSAQRGGDTVQNLLARTGAVERATPRQDPLAGVFAQFPTHADKLLSKPEGLAKAIAKMGPTAQRAANAMEGWTQLNAKLNDVQEGFFRRAIFEADLRNSLRAGKMDADAALANPGMIPEAMVAQATKRALKATFAKDPEGLTQPGIFAKDLINLFRKNPGLYLVHPFPRYMINRIEYFYEHSPVGLLELAQRSRLKGRFEKIIEENTPYLADAGTKERALFNIGKAQEGLKNLPGKAEIWGKAINGSLLPVLAALTLRNDDLAGEKWWQVKAGDKRIDMRPEATMAAPMFIAELAKQIHRHGWNPSNWAMTEEDLASGLSLLGARAGIGLTLVDLLAGRNNPGGGGWPGFLADVVSTIPTGFFNPIEQWHGPIGMAEEAMGFAPEELIRRDPRGDSALDRTWMPVAKQIPFFSRIVPASPNPTGPSPKRNQFPLAQFFGVQVTQPNTAERMLAERGYLQSQLYPDAGGDRPGQRALTAKSGPLVQELVGRLSQDPLFNASSSALQNLMIDRALSESKGRAMGEMPPEIREMILRKRMPKHKQEYLRELGQ